MGKRDWTKYQGDWILLASLTLLSIALISVAAVTALGLSVDVIREFFHDAVQVEVGLLLAVFVLASFIVPRLPAPHREHYTMLFSLDVVIFFVGLLASAVMTLASPTGTDAALGVVAIMITWWAGVAMLLDGIGASRFVKGIDSVGDR